MRPLARTPVQLKAISWGSEMRLFLRGAEVWLGNEYLGDISGEWLAAAVERHLAELALAKRFQVEMEPHRLGVPAPEPQAPPQSLKERRRRSRRERSKDK